jgi:hypothetical protein
LSSRLKGQVLFAQIEIDENRLVAFHTAGYKESVKPNPKDEPAPDNTSLLHRLHLDQAEQAHAINATIQVPEVDSRRIAGEWLIPSKGALVVSLGVRSRHEKGAKKRIEEHLIAITARPVSAGNLAMPASPRRDAAVTRAGMPRRTR